MSGIETRHLTDHHEIRTDVGQLCGELSDRPEKDRECLLLPLGGILLTNVEYNFTVISKGISDDREAKLWKCKS